MDCRGLGSTALLAATPTFWTVSSQARLPEGGRRRPLDRQRRPHVPRTERGAGRRDARRPSSGRCWPAPNGTLWAGTGNEGQVLKIATRRQGLHVLRFERARGARAGAGAGRRPLRGDLPRRPDLPGRRGRHVARRSSIPTTSTSGRWPWRPTAPSSPPPAKRAPSTGSRPDGKGRVFYKTNTTNVVSAGDRQERQRDRRDRIARPDLPHRSAGQGVRAARLAVQGNPHDQARAPTARSTRPPSAARPAVRIGRRRRSRRPRSRRARQSRRSPPRSRRSPSSMPVPACRRRQSSSRDPRSRGRQGGDLSHPARRAVGHDLGGDRRLAVRPARRDRRRRSSSAPARKASCSASQASLRGRRCWRAPRRVRSRRCSATRPAAIVARHQQPGQSLRARHRAGRRAGPTTPTSAMPARWRRWGAIRWRGGRERPVRSSSISRSGNTATPDETWSAWSKPYTTAQGEPISSPNARYLQWRAVLEIEPGRRIRSGSDVGDRRVPATQSASGRLRASPCTRPARSSSVPSRPASWRSPASRTTRPTAGRPTQPTVLELGRPRRRMALARARPPDLSEGTADVRLEGGRRERRPAAVRRVLPPRRGNGVEAAQARSMGSHLCLGHDVGARRHLLRQDCRVRRAVELPRHGARRASSRASASTSTTPRRTSRCTRRRRGPARRRRSSSSCATSSRRFSVWSIRSMPAGGGWRFRWTGLPIRGVRSSR